jgi:hypothetical protein
MLSLFMIALLHMEWRFFLLVVKRSREDSLFFSLYTHDLCALGPITEYVMQSWGSQLAVLSSSRLIILNYYMLFIGRPS